MFFSWITSKLLKLGEQAWHHRVPLVKLDRSICFLFLKGQFWNLTTGHARSRSQCDLIRSCCISGDAPWRDEHCETNPTSLAHFYPKLLAKNVRRTDDVMMWPQMTFQREMMQQRAVDIKHSLSDYDSGWVGQIWCILEVSNFFHHWLIMGRSRNWHDLWSPVSKIRNIPTNCRHLCPYCTREFQRVWITGVPLARCQTSKNATWGQVTPLTPEHRNKHPWSVIFLGMLLKWWD